MSGWIKLHRSITTHWLYTEKRIFSKYEAWNDMLLNVNYLDNKTSIKGKLYDVKRGQSIMSLDTWAKRWNWDKSKVRRFLNLLQKDNMIELKSDTITTQITICNYASYQDTCNTDETQMKRKRNADETQTTPIEERKEEKEIYNIDFDGLVDFINNAFGRKFTVVSKAVKEKYRSLLKQGYKKDQILSAINNCKNDSFHKEKNYQYCTIEYFSRSATIDKYGDVSTKDTRLIMSHPTIID